MIALRIAAIPRRSSVETWIRIIELVSARGSAAEGELTTITATAAMLIAEEWTASSPINISGGGPLVRLYTVHGVHAIESDPDDETDLPMLPTDGDGWLLSLPAGDVDLALARDAVASCPHVEVRDTNDATAASARERTSPTAKTGGLNLHLEELERP